jgi:hypothetical protein
MEVGDTVKCRLYNVPEQTFYGDPWLGQIIEIGPEPDSIAMNRRDRWLGTAKQAKIPQYYIDRNYLVTQPNGKPPIRLTLNEITKW